MLQGQQSSQACDTPRSPGPDSPEVEGLIAAFEHLGDPVLITSPELSAPGPVIIAVNEAFCQMTRYSREEIVGKTPRILQGPKTDRGTLDRLKDVCLRGERFVGEAVNYTRDGAEYAVEWSIDPVRGADRKVACFVAVQRDVTARTRREKASRDDAMKAVARESQQMAALIDTVLVLEQTKRSFRSTELGKLRERLNRLVRRPTRAE